MFWKHIAYSCRKIKVMTHTRGFLIIGYLVGLKLYFSDQEYRDRHYISQHFFTKLQQPSTFTSSLPSWQSDACWGCVSSQTSYSWETWGHNLDNKSNLIRLNPNANVLHSPFMLMCFLSEGFFRPFLWSLRDWLWAVWFLDFAMVVCQDLWNKWRWWMSGQSDGSHHTMTIFLFYFNVSDKAGRQEDRLELDHLSLALLLSAQLKVLGPLDGRLENGKKMF